MKSVFEAMGGTYRQYRDIFIPEMALPDTHQIPIGEYGRMRHRYLKVEDAESSVIVYSLVETAKSNSIDPYDYLFYTLSVLPYFGKSPAHERLETLMPRHPEVQNRYGPAAKKQGGETE